MPTKVERLRAIAYRSLSAEQRKELLKMPIEDLSRLAGEGGGVPGVNQQLRRAATHVLTARRKAFGKQIEGLSIKDITSIITAKRKEPQIICNPDMAEESLKGWGSTSVYNYVEESKEVHPAYNGFMTRDGRISDFEELHDDVADDIIREQNPELSVVVTYRLVQCGFPRVGVGYKYRIRDVIQANVEVASKLTPDQKQSIRTFANLVDDNFYFDIHCKDKYKNKIDMSGKGIEDFFEKFRTCVF